MSHYPIITCHWCPLINLHHFTQNLIENQTSNQNSKSQFNFQTNTLMIMIMNSISVIILTFFFFFFCFLQLFPSQASPLFPTQAHPTKSGYLPVDSTSKSAIYYTYYEAQKPISPLSQTPILVWLQGGPGCSSLIGNFFELGPWRVIDPDHKDNSSSILKRNPGSWNHLFGLVFLDNPIGTGFSIAATYQEIPRDQYTVAKHLFVALKHFISLDPTFSSRPIYMTGESYAGKYVPAIGYYILKHNARVPESQKVNLKGVAIGNGLTDPVTQVTTHAATAYVLDLINEQQRHQLEKLQAEAVRLVREKKWGKATDARNRVLDWLQNKTGLATLYDRRRKRPYETELVAKFLEHEEVKKVLGVEKSMVWEDCSSVVAKALHEDVMKSTKFMVEELLKKSKVLLYQGEFDLRDGVVSTVAWIEKLKWEGLEEFSRAFKNDWVVNGKSAGYVQKWESLTDVVISGAGHLVPADQALSSQAMIQDWILERGLFDDEEQVSSLNFRGDL